MSSIQGQCRQKVAQYLTISPEIGAFAIGSSAKGNGCRSDQERAERGWFLPRIPPANRDYHGVDGKSADSKDTWRGIRTLPAHLATHRVVCLSIPPLPIDILRNKRSPLTDSDLVGSIEVRATARDLVVWSLTEKQIRRALAQHNVHHVTIAPEFIVDDDSEIDTEAAACKLIRGE